MGGDQGKGSKIGMQIGGPASDFVVPQYDLETCVKLDRQLSNSDTEGRPCHLHAHFFQQATRLNDRMLSLESKVQNYVKAFQSFYSSSNPIPEVPQQPHNNLPPPPT